jgi:hypothetical protein
LVLGLAFAIFILARLRAEPVEDKEDEERRRSIEKSLGLGESPNGRGRLLPFEQKRPAQDFRPQNLFELTGYRLRQNLISGIKAFFPRM